jgi:hypothetical protein
MRTAKMLKGFLENEKIKSIWIDWEQIKAGEDINVTVQNGVAQATCCVFLLDEHSAKSTWCMAEVGAFWGAGKPVVVYNLLPSHDAIPPFLRDIKYLDDPEEVVKSVKEILKNLPEQRTDAGSLLNTLRRHGLTQAFKVCKGVGDPNREPTMSKLISDEHHAGDKAHFRLVAGSGFSYLSRRGPGWRDGLGDAVGNGARLSVVLQSPFSQFAVTRALANGTNRHHWEAGGEVILTEVVPLCKKYPNVAVKVTDYDINCSLFFTRNLVLFDPYLWGRPSVHQKTENNFWVLGFQKVKLEGGNECCSYGMLEKHFEFLWCHSIPLLEFCSDPAVYQKKTEDFRAHMDLELRRSSDGILPGQ